VALHDPPANGQPEPHPGVLRPHERVGQPVPEFVRVTAATGVDLDSRSPGYGRLIPNKAKEPKLNRVVLDVTPVHAGAEDWSPCAFSPRTGYLYIPHMTMAMDWEGAEANYFRCEIALFRPGARTPRSPSPGCPC
jgi:alcohol dehydrogenase (cytochrome c)